LKKLLEKVECSKQEEFKETETTKTLFEKLFYEHAEEIKASRENILHETITSETDYFQLIIMYLEMLIQRNDELVSDALEGSIFCLNRLIELSKRGIRPSSWPKQVLFVYNVMILIKPKMYKDKEHKDLRNFLEALKGEFDLLEDVLEKQFTDSSRLIECFKERLTLIIKKLFGFGIQEMEFEKLFQPDEDKIITFEEARIRITNIIEMVKNLRPLSFSDVETLIGIRDTKSVIINILKSDVMEDYFTNDKHIKAKNFSKSDFSSLITNLTSKIDDLIKFVPFGSGTNGGTSPNNIFINIIFSSFSHGNEEKVLAVACLIIVTILHEFSHYVSRITLYDITNNDSYEYVDYHTYEKNQVNVKGGEGGRNFEFAVFGGDLISASVTIMFTFLLVADKWYGKDVNSFRKEFMEKVAENKQEREKTYSLSRLIRQKSCSFDSSTNTFPYENLSTGHIY
jgi:hypothetical protein